MKDSFVLKIFNVAQNFNCLKGNCKMKTLLILSLSALTLAACAPQPQGSNLSQRGDNAIKASIATDIARTCPRQITLVRGGGYADGMAYSREIIRQEVIDRVRADMQDKKDTGFCERVQSNLLGGRYFNPYLKAR
jgi:hypothetical protein